MLFTSLASAAPALLGYTLGLAPPAGASCVAYGGGPGSCGPSLHALGELDIVTLQADTCHGLVTSISVTWIGASEPAADATAAQLRSALAALGWSVPEEPRVAGSLKSWSAPPSAGGTALVAIAPSPVSKGWSAVAVVKSGDGVCRDPG